MSFMCNSPISLICLLAKGYEKHSPFKVIVPHCNRKVVLAVNTVILTSVIQTAQKKTTLIPSVSVLIAKQWCFWCVYSVNDNKSEIPRSITRKGVIFFLVNFNSDSLFWQFCIVFSFDLRQNGVSIFLKIKLIRGFFLGHNSFNFFLKRIHIDIVFEWLSICFWNPSYVYKALLHILVILKSVTCQEDLSNANWKCFKATVQELGYNFVLKVSLIFFLSLILRALHNSTVITNFCLHFPWS